MLHRFCAGPAGFRGCQRQPFEMRFTCVLGALCAFGRRQRAVGVDVALELVEHRSARVGSSRRPIGGVGPRLVGSDLSAQRTLSRG